MKTQHFCKQNYKLINMCEIGLFLFLKVPMIIIMRFCENNVSGTIIQFQGVGGGGVTQFTLPFFLSFIKMEKVQEHGRY